ncbi:hypothetical protein QBC44DRAFT_336921 [Cladorrhinum sp. PSN332]|nr:hypothetical protein QBC44DRAFT_336921 [Cladorrhinum sp. PSN332]
MAQSPPPERQFGKQLHDVPGSGKGIDDASNKVDDNKKALENLTSNPKGPLDDEVTKKFAKTTQTSNEDKQDK